MKMPTFQSNNRGFTVVELMVAMVVGLMVTGVAVAVFVGSAKTYRLANTNADLIETGRMALDAIERDLRMAGFRGCNSNNVGGTSPLNNVITTPANHENNLGVSVRVSNASGGGVFAPALPVALPGVVDDSDVLIVRMPSGPVLSLNASMAAGTAAIPLANTGNLAVGSRAVVANCSASVAFRVSGITGTDLEHAVGAYNSTADLGLAFETDSIVVPYVTRVYYVAPSSSGVAGERSLWQMDDNNAAEEVIENVRQMQILVGLDTDANMVANRYVTAGAATNFATVVAVQIHLMTRGNRLNETTTELPITFAGQTTTATDRFARRVFSSTVLLRNRTL